MIAGIPNVIVRAAMQREEDRHREAVNPYPVLACFGSQLHRPHAWFHTALKEPGPYWCNGQR